MTSPAPAAAARIRSLWPAGLLLAAAIGLAYLRVWHCGFIWDDDDHLTSNPCIVGPLGFPAIWTSSKAVYYPLVLTSFWLQHKLWGLNPLPYHVVNVALHACAALLLWRVLVRLRVWGAWLGAALWALHPVQVESVAWITEQKNTQSSIFYLLCILAFLRWHAEQPARPGRYALALLCAVLAILSKSSTVMLPVVLGLCAWWVDGQWRRRTGLALLPFAFVSFAASLWTIWEQKYANHALGAEWSQSWPQRMVVAGKDIWFYLGKLAWPRPLIFIYPRWNPDPGHLSSYLPLMAAALFLALLWFLREGRLRPVFFAVAYFVVSLFPVLGFFNVYFFRYSFVGDHFQYLASMGPLALAGSAVAALCSLAPPAARATARTCAAALLLIPTGLLTWLQCGVYFNLETLWRSTLAANPAAFIAHYDLADVLVHEGHLDEAALQYREQLALMPASVEAAGNLANILLMQGHIAAAVAQYEKLLTLDPSSSQAHGNLSAALLREGRMEEAIAHARTAVQLEAKAAPAGQPPADAAMLRLLAAAYAGAGRYADAATAARTALKHAAEAGASSSVIDALTRELGAYEAAARTPSSPQR